MGDKLYLAIVSDLHCRHSNGQSVSEANTYLTTDLMKIPLERNPVEALKKVISENNLRADFLLCPGDITDKTDKQGLVTGWNYLEEIKRALACPTLAATIGNHDIDSRKSHGTDPFDLIRRFAVNFPTQDQDSNNFFWSNHYCLIGDSSCDLLIINSSFNHVDSINCYKSEIKASTLAMIENSLQSMKNNGKVKVAMSHHHPMKHSNIDYGDEDSMEKGDELLALLESNNFSLFIHGHKHDPRLNYSGSLPVFACGSFSSMMNLSDIGAENTFHYIELDLKEPKKGEIKTWIYLPKSGWSQKKDTHFPCFTGFGASSSVEELADKCIQFIQQHSEETMKYSELVGEFSDLRFLIPSEQIKLNEIFQEKNITLLPELPNLPRMVSKQYI